MLLNMGSFIWAFKAGTGETLIAPLYHVLKKRDVRFKFFHKVTAVRSHNGKSITSIEFDEQAKLKDSTNGYDPLVCYKGLLCWPDQPKYDLIVEGDRLTDFNGSGAVDLESYWSPWNAAANERLKTIYLGAEFDKVVFALGVEVVAHLCEDILAADGDGRWQRMIDNVKTCPTQTMQVWLLKDPGPLARNRATTRATGDPSKKLNATFVQPFNGQVDFSTLLDYENWPCGNNSPISLWYFSGAMSDEPPVNGFSDRTYPERQYQRVKHQAIQFLQATTGYLLDSSSATWSPMGMDFATLWSANPDAKGIQRFESQFWRANIDPTERYTLAQAGSTRHRLKADGGGIENLALAGDWIYNGINLGSVEGAVMGGMLAADAIQGKPVLGEHVMGYPQAPSPTPPRAR